MIRLLFFILTLAIPFKLFPQLLENFSDGDLTSNPEWQGDLTNFTINNEMELQLAAPVAGSSKLFTTLDIPDSTIWEIFLRLDFSPSSSNLLRIYLQLDAEDLNVARGYYLEIGESGSNDALQMFRKEGTDSQLLAKGTAGAVGGEPVMVRLRLTRTSLGEWTMAADYSGGRNFEEEAVFKDATFPGGENKTFGLFCQYTASRTDKFFFDDISINPLIPDNQAPGIIAVEAVSPTELELYFDEPLTPNSAEIQDNYMVSNIGPPIMAEIDEAQKNLVHLGFAGPGFESGQNYKLEVRGVSDLSGNAIVLESFEFVYINIQTGESFDVLINEIMADPSPTIGLPNWEFVELFNRSEKIINLEGFRLSSGANPQDLPAFLLYPGNYLILCEDNQVNLFSDFGDVLGLNSFPSLSNTGDEILLEDPEGNPIHFVQYTKDWYLDNSKAEGGWTLELISPKKPCALGTNWRASDNISGGTPGTINSVFLPDSDNSGPELLKVFPLNSTSLKLLFNEALDIFTASDVSNYQISNGMVVSTARLEGPEQNQIALTLSTILEPRTIYEITLEQTLTDCLGNALSNNQMAVFGLPESPLPGEVLINEILFDPYTGGADFIELYNPSGKIINIKELAVANFFMGEQSIQTINEPYLLFPGNYVALTASPSNISAFYNVLDPKAIQANPLPAFPNKEGNVTIYLPDSPDPVIIDAFDYSEDFHFPLLKETEGVSLERISPASPTQDSDNWHSASATIGYATPGYRNSQFLTQLDASNELISLENETFSPDGDGFKDFLLIHFNSDNPGNLVNMKIFDAHGRLINDFLKNQLLGTADSFKWDGTTDEGEKARLGIYIIWVEFFNPNGDAKQLKRSCVVAGQLD